MIIGKYTSPTEDLSIVDFGDKRLTQRLKKSTEERQNSVGKTRSSAKGFYRLLGNEKFDKTKIEAAAQQATIERVSNFTKILLVQDSVEINLHGHKKTKGLGYSSELVKGINVHHCLAFSVDGLPLGLLSQSYSTRPEARSELSKYERSRRPIEEKESYWWIETLQKSMKLIPDGTQAITVCDREGDIFELYAQVQKLCGDFVIRIAQNRKTETNSKIFERIRNSATLGTVTLKIPRDSAKNRKARTAVMAVCACSVRISKKKNSVPLNIVRIVETSQTDGSIEWILATSLAIENADDVMMAVEYYVQRWKIERFHYVLKSGCKVEEIQQRTYERILPVILICSLIANFILALNYFARISPNAPCDLFFEVDEWQMLYRFAKRTKTPPAKPYSLAEAIALIGILGVGKRAPSDGDVGVKAIWIGLKNFYFSLELFVGQV